MDKRAPQPDRRARATWGTRGQYTAATKLTAVPASTSNFLVNMPDPLPELRVSLQLRAASPNAVDVNQTAGDPSEPKNTQFRLGLKP